MRMPSEPESAVTPAPATMTTARLATAEPMARPVGMKLRDIMALPEPRRTDLLEQVVQAGEIYYLRAKGKKPISLKYGERVLTVPTKPKPFQAPHAIHLFWYLGDEIEEVGEEEEEEAAEERE